MRGRALIRLGVFTLALTATAASRQPPARAATLWTAPRTSWGDPDFSGLWNYATMTPLERAQAFAGKDVLTEGEAAAYEKQTTDR
jgi:hypothetical protein